MIYEHIYGNVYFVAYGNIFAVELYLSLIFFIVFQPRRKYFAFRTFLCTVGYFLFESLIWYAIVTFAERSPYLNAVFFLVCTVFLSAAVLICFKTSILGAVYFATGAYAVQHAAYSLGNIIKCLTNPEIPEWANIFVFDFLVYAFVGALFFMAFIFPRRKKFGFDIFDARAFAVSSITLVMCVVLSLLVDGVFTQFYEKGIDVTFMRIYCSAYAVIGCVASLVIQFCFLRENRLADEKTVLDELIRTEAKRHEMSKETMGIINAKCHDLKNQILTLSKIDDREARKEYVRELENSVAIYDTSAETGNAAVDIIISEKGLLCEKNKISFSYLVDGAKLSFISSSDIAAILGNAFDNAIERQLKEKEENRFISLYVKEESGFIHMHMDNCCTVAPDFKEGLPQTDKNDKNNHGYGTKSIQNVVNKYSGDLFMCVEDDRFNIDILFPIEE